MSNFRDTIGPIGVSMDDIALMDEIVTNQRHKEIPEAKTIRIAIPKENYYEDLDPEV